MNAVFIRPPRVAGASIVAALGAREYQTMERVENGFVQSGVLSFGHIDYEMLVVGGYVSQEFDSTALKFTFVRNPYDRAVSWFFFAQARHWIPESVTFVEFCRRAFADNMEPIGLYNGVGRSKYNPQIRWVEKVPLDFIGRYERLQVDLARVANMLDVRPTELPITHWTDHDHYATYYCEESADLVHRAYREDFNQLGYPTTFGGV